MTFRRLIPVFLPPIPSRVWSRLLWALLSAIALLSWAEPAAPPSAAQAMAHPPLAPKATDAAEVEAAVRSLQRQVETLTQQLAQAAESSPEPAQACKNEKNLKLPPGSSS